MVLVFFPVVVVLVVVLELVHVIVDVAFSHWEVLTKRAAHTQDHCDLTKGATATVNLVGVTVDVAFSHWEVLTK